MSIFQLSAAVCINKGKVRGNNEDNFLLQDRCLTPTDREQAALISKNISEEMLLCGVFDGMGGEEMGEEASYIAACALRQAAEQLQMQGGDIRTAVCGAVAQANTEICQKIMQHGGKRIGATFTALSIYENVAQVYNVGDSRVYLYRDKKLMQISVDDTSAQRMINMGILSPGEAKNHKEKHKLTQHLGIFDEELIIEPHISEPVELQADDIFLLCSDGLTDMVDDETIGKILSMKASSEALAESLVAHALENGGKDNVTALVVRAQKAGAQKGKGLKKWLLACIIAVLCACIAAGAYWFMRPTEDAISPGSVQKPPKQEAENHTEEKKQLEMPLGERVRFVYDGEAGEKKVETEISSSDTKVVEVQGEYVVAVGVGTATVKLVADGNETEIEITVTEEQKQEEQ